MIFHQPSTTSVPQRHHSRLSCVELESRVMLSGSIMATLIGDSLFLEGDNLNNEFELSVLGDDLVITGIADTVIVNEKSTTDSVTFENSANNLSNIFLFAHGGDDTVVFRQGINAKGMVHVDMGRGDDSFAADQLSVGNYIGIFTGTGDDNVAIRQSQLGGFSQVIGGRDNDTISIVDTQIGDTLLMVGNQGDDAISMTGSTIDEHLLVFADSGSDDVVVASSSIRYDMLIFGGPGSDLISVEQSNAKHALFFFGAGSDLGFLSANNQFDFSIVFGGPSEDAITSPEADYRFSTEGNVAQTTINNRLSSPGGFFAKIAAAEAVFQAPDNAPELTINLNEPGSPFLISSGQLITNQATFVSSGSTAAYSLVEVDIDGDNVFDDARVRTGADGLFEFSFQLNEDDNALAYRVTDRFGRTEIATQDVFLASGTVVEFQMNVGTFAIELFDELAPITVENFLNYQVAGLYDRSIIHRSEVGVNGAFLIQGGGYSLEGDTVNQIEPFDPIENEFNPANSNLRGTLAMVHPEGMPDGGTSQWFINLNDSNQVLDDIQLTVFGQVIGDGIDVVDSINALSGSEIGPAIGFPDLGNQTTPLMEYEAFDLTLDGTITGVVGSDMLTGSGTSFTQSLVAGQQILVDGNILRVESIVSDTELVLTTELTSELQDVSIMINDAPTAENYVVVNDIVVLQFAE